MTKLKDQFPRAGQECKFFLITGEEFIGFFDHGGAYDPSKITSHIGGTHYFEQFAIGVHSYDNIAGWEYYTKK